MSEVSIVIPNYNGMGYLKDCLDSLEVQSMRDFETILVDNGSEDESVSFVRERYPKVRIKRLEKNYGFCRAVNEGIRMSTSPYVILLNNDTRADIQLVQKLLAEIKKYPGCFSVQAKVVMMSSPDKMDDAGDFYCALGWAFAEGKGKPETDYQKSRRIFASCAAAAIYRKSVFKETGLFDERHFAYLEDVDMGYRARISGYENRFAADAVVYHHGSGTTGSVYNEFKIRYSSRNNVYVIYKNMPVLQIVLNLPLLALGFIIKGVFFSVKGYGGEYVKGVFYGLRTANKCRKVRFKTKNIRNYLIIQLELWRNIVRKLGF